jgi:hypothetical protein
MLTLQKGVFMGMQDGRARIGKTLKELMAHWRETHSQWNDSTSATFESRFLTPLEVDSRQAVSAMEGMGQILQQIKRDCE